MVEMRVKTIAVDAETKFPIMLLTDVDEKHFLPIYIGIFEAHAIITEKEGINQPRPMTHDLMKVIMDSLNAKVVRVVINDMQDSTYFARLILDVGGREVEIDARPSDSVALALRFKAPIFVTENVVTQAAMPDKSKIAEENRKFKEFMEHVSAEMFTISGTQAGPLPREETGPQTQTEE